jgi:alkanesulfonate monooxygenase SsuD/methylene tetrahydromethanopterin reductase-like flavin-dependent oxidoreductase (luciferase family)
VIRLGTSHRADVGADADVSIAMHVLTLDHLSGGRVDARHGRERAAGGGGVVRRNRSSKPLARTREVVVDHPPGAGDGKAPVTNDGPHHPLPYASARVPPVWASRSSRSCIHVARRRADLAGGGGSEERRADRRDRRRVDPDLLHAQVRGRDVPAVARRGLRPPRRAALPGRLSRSPRPATCRSPPARRRRRRSIDAIKPTVALYMGGMGAKDANFHKNGLRADGPRADLAADVQRALSEPVAKDRANRADP